MLPLSVLWMPAWHPHEMLFGFALAVVAGNQLGAVKASRTRVLFAAWVLARLSVFLLPFQLTALANAAFAALLAWTVAPRLFRSAKKLRNQALPAILVALCVAAAFQHARAAILLLAALMLFMGGRIIAPAVAGALQRQGVTLGPRVQPRLEAALVVLMALALVSLFLGTFLMGIFLICAGTLAAVRMARWRLWALRGRSDLLCLATGYAWLALGLAAFGAASIAGRLESAALHFITVGALGTLTFNVMAMGWLLKARAYPSRAAPIAAGTALIGIATAFRVLGAVAGWEWFVYAAGAWSAAFVLLLVVFIRPVEKVSGTFFHRKGS